MDLFFLVNILILGLILLIIINLPICFLIPNLIMKLQTLSNRAGLDLVPKAPCSLRLSGQGMHHCACCIVLNMLHACNVTQVSMLLTSGVHAMLQWQVFYLA